MKRVAVVCLLLFAACVGQSAVPMPDDQVPQRKEILNNNRVAVSLLTIPPGDSTPMHKHDRDLLTVFVSGGKTQTTLADKKPTADKMEVGEVRFREAGFTHSTKNNGPQPFVAVVVEFADAQGKIKKMGKKSHTCAPNREACVQETELFCTEKVCVEDVVMGPHSSSIRHSHSTDHMLVAVSDYELSDDVQGKGMVMRRKKSGEAEYIPAGITHQLKNAGEFPAHFVVIVWK